MRVAYLNRPDKSDPDNKVRVLVIGPWRFSWRALWDNGWRARYVPSEGVWKPYKVKSWPK